MTDSRLAIYQPIIEFKRDAALTANFRVSELIKTNKTIDNWPKSTEIIWKLHNLCWFVLQPIRNHFRASVNISSGYRCEQLNAMIGGAHGSQHIKGEAADFEVSGVDNRELAKWISKNINYDQLILEFYRSNEGIHSGWVHCSYKPSGNRKEFLVARKGPANTQYLPASLHELQSL
jgi:hypothetical protein